VIEHDVVGSCREKGKKEKEKIVGTLDAIHLWVVQIVYLNYIKLGCRPIKTLLIMCQLKLLYNNHSYNHRKYKGLSSIKIKSFLRREELIS
jgi:hypothetical protein